MAFAEIDYGFGRAKLWGVFEEPQAERVFMRLANQCFGLRKSIAGFNLISFDQNEGLPEPWANFPGAASVLKHSGDTIVWDGDGEKIKSEWD